MPGDDPTRAAGHTPPSTWIGSRLARVLYRLLLHLYPRTFRRAYGRELQETFDAQRLEPSYQGPAGALAFWCDITADLVASVVRVRAGALADSRDRRRQRRALHAALARTRASAPTIAPDTERTGLDVMLHDLRYSLRLLARRPGFTLVSVLTLALGLGGTSIVFGLVDGLVLKPFAFPDPDRLVSIGVRFPKTDTDDRFIEALSPLESVDIRAARTLMHVQAFDLGNRHVSGGDQPERLFTALVLGDLFPTLGVRPHLGRGFTRDELAPGGPLAAVISHRVWQSRFAGDPAIVGRTIRVNGTARTIVGVMPPRTLVVGTDLWLPQQATASDWPRDARMFTLLARIAPGATLTQANAELSAIASRVAAVHGREREEYDGWRLRAAPLAHVLTRSFQPAAYLLLGAIGFVLLIVCVNIASLQLARASSRQREMAVRLALGAGHWRVGRQLLLESVLLAGTGCALGLIVAAAGLRAVLAWLPSQVVAAGAHVQFSGRVLMVSMTAAACAAVIVGVLPAIKAMRADPYESLKQDSRHATAGMATHRVRYGLIVAEIALAMILLAGAGLLTRTVLRLSRIEPGFEVRNVLTMRLTLPREKYREEAIPVFFEQLVARVQAIPGVRAAAVASQYPPGNMFQGSIRFEGRTADANGPRPQTDTTIAGSELFRTLGIALRAGRTFTTEDGASAPRVAIVNELFARRFYRGASPLGQRFAWNDPKAPWITIVGVAADTRGRGVLREPQPEVYLPPRQETVWNQLFLLVRTDGEPRALLPAVRREIVAMDSDQPVYAIQTIEEAFASSLFTQRALMTLLLAFAGLAVTLAAIGTYAVMSYAVTARTQEIGIRIALGAGTRAVMGMVVGQVLWLVGTGVAIGLAGALALGGLVSGVLAGTTASDPLTLGAVSVLLAAVAIVAGYVPARRASRIDPVIALRVE